MQQYQVKITDEALADMEQIYDYIAYKLLSPENAIGQYHRIADAILTLDTMPERFRLMDSEPERTPKLRRMLVDHYNVFYVMEEDQVVVTNVLYSASDIENRLRQQL